MRCGVGEKVDDARFLAGVLYNFHHAVLEEYDNVEKDHSGKEGWDRFKEAVFAAASVFIFAADHILKLDRLYERVFKEITRARVSKIHVLREGGHVTEDEEKEWMETLGEALKVYGFTEDAPPTSPSVN